MHSNDYKYIHYEDKLGEAIGYIDPLRGISEDMLFIVLISEKNKGKDWVKQLPGIVIAVDLKKVKSHKFYDDYEEFCTKFLEAIL